MTRTRIELLLIEYSNIAERKKELNTMIKEVELLKKNSEDTLRTPLFDGLPHGKTAKDLVFQAVQRILDEYQTHLDYYYSQLKLYVLSEKAMFEALKCLEPHEYNVIYWRYLKGHRWETVAIKTSYSRRQCFVVRDMAIEKLINNYKE